MGGSSHLLSRSTIGSRWWRLGTALAYLAFGLGLTLSASSPDDEIVGFVLEKRGDWYLDGPQPRSLSEGDRLAEGATIRPKDQAPGKKKCSLTVCFSDGVAKVYSEPGTLTLRSKSNRSRLSRLWKVIAGRYSGGYVHAMSRGRELSDGVVELKNEQIDPSAIFHVDNPGEYHLRFALIATTPSTVGGAVTIKFKWDAKRPATVSAVGLRPGLYKCAVVAADGRVQGDATAWVLVREARAYAQAAKTYQEAVDLSEKWDESVSSHAVLSFRRACLKALAESERQ
jgi:hypothetical protein